MELEHVTNRVSSLRWISAGPPPCPLRGLGDCTAPQSVWYLILKKKWCENASGRGERDLVHRGSVFFHVHESSVVCKSSLAPPLSESLLCGLSGTRVSRRTVQVPSSSSRCTPVMCSTEVLSRRKSRIQPLRHAFSNLLRQLPPSEGVSVG